MLYKFSRILILILAGQGNLKCPHIQEYEICITVWMDMDGLKHDIRASP